MGGRFQGLEEEAEAEPDDEEGSPLPNIPQMSFYFEQAGIGLNREEMIRIWLALKTLVVDHSPEKVRFWGKILGMQQNYVVAEVDLPPGEGEEEEEEEDDASIFYTLYLHVCVYLCAHRYYVIY